MSNKAPVLRKNYYSYGQWMQSVVRGKTPCGKRLAKILFRRSKKIYVGNFNEIEIVGPVVYAGHQFDDDGYLRLGLGSVVVYREPINDTLNECTGIMIEIRPS